MPDTDLATLAAQVRAIGGDLDRSFEQLNALAGRLDQLSGRLGAVSVIATLLPFGAALGGNWVDGITSPETVVPGDNVGATSSAVALGEMFVALPNRARIQTFRAFIRVDDIELLPADAGVRNADICELIVSLKREALDRRQTIAAIPAEPIVELSHRFVSGRPELHGDPISGREIVDQDVFRYFFSAEFRVRPAAAPGPGFVVPHGMVVINSFEVDCASE